MVKQKVVLALGGNALQRKGEASAEAQKAVVREVGEVIAKLAEKYDIVVAHGNGPQVGNILIHEEMAGTKEAPAMPLETAVAMSQGEIGYWLAQAIQNAFTERGKKKKVATVITQVEVDRKDPAFRRPTKPIGQFYTAKEALRLAKSKGWIVKEDAGRGYRRVVPSPKPKSIVEKREIVDLVAAGAVVIAVGGGGIPVYRTKILKKIKGVDAVIDKDFAGEKLAEEIGADIFVSVTAVENVCLNYGTEEEVKLGELTIGEAEKYAKEGYFAEGSMLPKVEACVAFAKKGKVGIITGIEKLEEALKGRAGTRIA